MRYCRKLLILTMLAAATVLSLAAGAASARNFSTSETRFFDIWDSELELSKTDLSIVFSNGATLRCKLTLEGRFQERTIPKILNAQIQEITGASIASCNERTTILAETLPWRVNYGGFTGRLPEITGLIANIINFGIKTEIFGATCLVRTTTTEPFVAIFQRFRRESTESIRADETRTISTGAFCSLGATARFQGLGLIRRTLTGGSLVMTLI